MLVTLLDLVGLKNSSIERALGLFKYQMFLSDEELPEHVVNYKR